MLECPNCRRTFPTGTRFCGTCGNALTGTIPGVVSENRVQVEPLADIENVPRDLMRVGPEDTIVRKRPEGFSWQAQQASSGEKESVQAAYPMCATLEEATIIVSKSALTQGLPETPASSVLQRTTGPSFTVPPLLHPSRKTSMVTPAAVADASPPAEAANEVQAPEGTGKVSPERVPFAIPARPGRVADSISTDQAPASTDEMTISLSPTTPQIIEPRISPNRVKHAEEALIDYRAFVESLNEAGLSSLEVSELESQGKATLPAASPLSETLISSELLVEIAELSSSFHKGGDLLSTIKAEGESAVPTSPETPAPSGLSSVDERSLSAVEESAEVQNEVETHEAHFSTVPDASMEEAQGEESAFDPKVFWAPFLKPDDVPAQQRKADDPYLHLKQELAVQRMQITSSMDELLPLVYDNHRDENQALFAHILAHRPALDDEAWGHAAFVLGAYGNYMYRHPLSFTKKLEIWRAQLWAVYYERSYRRKYLAQRCQQLIHFFQGCAENATFLSIALHDLETLYLYLEPGSLRKLQACLQALPQPPIELLQRIEAYMEVAEHEKAERMARQLSATQPKTQTQPASAESLDRTAAFSGRVQPDAGTVLATASERKAVPARGTGKRTIIHPLGAGEPEDPAEILLVRGRAWLDFLSEQQQRQFFESLRADRLETISQLLLPARAHILNALRAELLRVGPVAYQRPRKSVPVRVGSRNGSDHDRFVEALRLLNSARLKDQQIALHMFEQNARENTPREHQQGAREWMLYARAIIQGSTRVAPDWEREVKQGNASWEEIWNLAYYHYVLRDLVEVVHILAPGLHALEAPVSHLRLALICALAIVLDASSEAPIAQEARVLLLRHLERWPHPLSCLAWLALSYDTVTAPRPLDQSRRLSVFQELLEYALELPDPRVDLTEAQIYALRDALTNKTHCEEAWFLWLNDYASRRPRNLLSWQLLAETSERMGRLERAELALQHIAGMYYDFDYVYAQEGDEQVQAAEGLRSQVEKLFAFYQRHKMQRQAWDSFESCYATLKTLGFWDERRAANRQLLALVKPFLLEYQRREQHQHQAQHLLDVQDARARSEIRRNELSNNPTRPLEHFRSGRRVGIFVDYENIARLIPANKDMEEVWQTLASYAAQFGDVVCRWASASPRNLTNLTDVRAGLEAAQFKIRYPRRELQFSASQKDLADYALLECINNASLNDRLDVYLIVSGDRDYYERIYSLLETGSSVRILASACNLSTSYRELVQQRQRKHEQEGHEESDFFIDDLEEVLHSRLA